MSHSWQCCCLLSLLTQQLCLACLHLQNTKGQAARAPTADELREVVFSGIQQAIYTHPTWSKLVAAGVVPILSLDNAPVHKAAMTEQYQADQRLIVDWVPPYSPDLNKPIEHSHANTVRAFRKEQYAAILRGQGLRSMGDIPALFERLEQCFKRANPLEAVRDDVHSLKETYAAVMACNGGYPPAAFR